jgi:hypothetical protein
MEETEVIKNEGDSSRAAFSHEMKWDCRLLQSESESTLFFSLPAKVRAKLETNFSVILE